MANGRFAHVCFTNLIRVRLQRDPPECLLDGLLVRIRRHLIRQLEHLAVLVELTVLEDGGGSHPDKALKEPAPRFSPRVIFLRCGFCPWATFLSLAMRLKKSLGCEMSERKQEQKKGEKKISS